MVHKPVLLNEILSYVLSKDDGVYFEGTVGFAGHTTKILEQLPPSAKYLGTDKDISAFKHSTDLLKNDSRFTLYNTGFTNIDVIADMDFVQGFDFIFADLGVSSFQIDNAEEGFTFREEGPLDLRMDKTKGESAAKVLNTYDEKEIADIIYNYGEEKKSRQLARKVVETREKKPFELNSHLIEIINTMAPPHMRIKMLSRVFQALRIHVNNELDELEEFLDKAVDLLNPGGRVLVITFHSLEDRIVKEKFKYETLDCICPTGSPICTCDKEKRLKVLTKKPVTAGNDELEYNNRARSAKLRVAEKL